MTTSSNRSRRVGGVVTPSDKNNATNEIIKINLSSLIFRNGLCAFFLAKNIKVEQKVISTNLQIYSDNTNVIASINKGKCKWTKMNINELFAYWRKLGKFKKPSTITAYFISTHFKHYNFKNIKTLFSFL
jgi:hypothetical protein